MGWLNKKPRGKRPPAPPAPPNPYSASGSISFGGGNSFACSGVITTQPLRVTPQTPEEIRAERLAEYNMLKSQLQRMERDLIEDGILKDQRDESEEFELRGSL